MTEKPNSSEDYFPAKVPLETRDTREQIIKYLSLHGLKCVAVEQGAEDEFAVGTYYVMKPHAFLEDGLRFTKPRGREYLPDYKEMLEHDFYTFYLELGDEDQYSVTINTVDTAVLKKKYSWIENYDGLLFMITDIPEKGSRIAFPSEFKGGGQDESVKEKILHDDPYLVGLDVDPEEFYALVDQIQQEMRGRPERDEEDYFNDDFMDGDAIAGEAYQRECNVPWKVFQECGMVYKFKSAYFDIWEYFSWVTAEH